MTNKILLVTVLCAIIGLAYFLRDEVQPAMSYSNMIESYRLECDEFMDTDEESPFVNADSTIRLKYYPINEDFAVIARIELIEGGQFVTLGTSDGKPRKYKKHAYAHFKLDERDFKLLVLKVVSDGEELFLAFSDLTSNDTTYGGGRYLNVNFNTTKSITLDFNKAYNPYCEYSIAYSCPLPPAENNLDVAIMAGEMLYK